jgi:DNA-binding CsgD family transcriptional regulator
MMLGRERELAAALDVLRAAGDGRGSVLVITGEPGIGKSTLLEACVSGDPARRVVRATGVEAERAVAFATLQALLWPLRDALGEIESGQQRLLSRVLDLGAAEGATAFVVGAATLALVSVSSRAAPLVLTVDDGQWADLASQEVLCFVGRRLEHENAALLVGVRDGDPCLFAEERSFAQLRLEGLPAVLARELLERSASERLDPDVVEWLLTACAGNPLGLVELPALLSPEQRQGTEPLQGALEAGPLVRRAFAARVRVASRATQRVLLLVAAAGGADRELLVSAGVSKPAIARAEAVALVERRGKLEFRHPLLRAAVYGDASPAARREAHRALAAVVDERRRAWHLADAAEGPDESVASKLETVALGARVGGSVAAEAQAFERAIELTPDDEVRAVRLLAAARAWRRTGRIAHSEMLLQQALSLAGTARTRAMVQLERGSIRVRGGEVDSAAEFLLVEAALAEPEEPKIAAQMLVEAVIALDTKPDIERAVELAERSVVLAGSDGDRPELEAVNALITARTSTGIPPDSRDLELILRAAELLEQPELRRGSEEVHWIAYCLALHERDDAARHLSDRSLAEARAAGDVWSLCFGLYARAAIEQTAGRIDAAYAWVGEAVSLAEQIGEPWRLVEAYGLLAEAEIGRGDPDRVAAAHEHKTASSPDPRPRLVELYVRTAVGTALVACARYTEAIERLELARQTTDIVIARTWYHLTPLELAEAYVRVGRRKDAEAVLRAVADGIEGCPLVRAQIKLARVRGLLAREGEIDAAFGSVLALLEEVPQHLEHARVELCWGEQLVRGGRSTDAVAHLERALARFEALGADGWAGRARVGLEAASGTARLAQPRRTDALTAQELRVSRHAASGMRDRDIAARLYLSPRTIESYLSSAYRKLGVSNRTQLAGVLASDGVRPVGVAADPVDEVP